MGLLGKLRLLRRPGAPGLLAMTGKAGIAEKAYG